MRRVGSGGHDDFQILRNIQTDQHLASGFAVIAAERLHDRLGEMERDDDELLKQVAVTTYDQGGYKMDAV